MRIVSTSVIALGIALATTQPARADCCNDFWSCAAAVATGGLSCAVSAAVDELNNLKNRAEASRSQAQAEKERLANLYTETANQEAAKAEADSAAAANATQVALTKVESSLQKLNVVVSPAATANIRSGNAPALKASPGIQANTGAAATGSAGQSQGTPQISQQASTGISGGKLNGAIQQLQVQMADDAVLKSESKRAKEEIAKQKAEADSAKAKMKADKTDPLRRIGQEGAQAMRTVFEASLIAPIVGLVGTLPPPDPLLTAAMIAAAVATLDRIEADGNAAIAAKAKEEDDKLAEKRKVTQEEVEKIKDNQKRSEEIEQLVAKAVASRTKADLDKLTAALGAPPPAPMRIAPGAIVLRPVAVTAFKPIGKGFSTAGGVKPAATATLAVKPVAIPAATMAQYKSKTEADIRLKLKASNAAETAKKRNALIAEAKIKFAKDPETLKKVIAYLEQAPAQ